MRTASAFAKLSWPKRVARDLVLFGLLGILTLTSRSPASQQPGQPQATRPANAPGQVAAEQPSQSDQDRELARKVRRALVTDKSLSIYAHNVKINARDGVVTLKGRVRSVNEKSVVLGKASQIAGANNVKDEMTVKGVSKFH